MEEIKLTMLEKLVAWLTGGQAYRQIKAVVETFMDADIPGEEKRKKVQSIVMPLFHSVSSVIINIAIEVAVAALRKEIKDARN